ncbi:MAG TPA: hypothetical protein VJ743_20470 [Albitalea sp.]|nr:hypothetical protein [Albitalea sp.]
MHAAPEPVTPDLSPAKSRALLAAALAAALLGLTLLDVAPLDGVRRTNGKAANTAECIVASAVFAGVSAAPAALH